jgi:hypothetical protein
MPQQRDQQTLSPPPHIAVRLPSTTQLQSVLLSHIIEVEADHMFIRAAWNDLSVWPPRVTKTYRFGPPDVLMGTDGRYPYHWVYVAEHVITAAWEAQFCANDVTRPGTFYIREGARDALMATLVFDKPIRLLDLTGTVVSKLGIYDALRSPDHEWCQWFGNQLDYVIRSQGGDIHGFRYPSRRHPGFFAYALSSRVMDDLADHLTYSTTKFGETDELKSMERDPCYAESP